VKGPALLLFSVVMLGCSNLTEGAGGVVGLDIRTPEVKTIEVGETLPLSAQALDKSGDPVAATITWQAPDPTLTVDQSGVITGVSPGTGRVQAFVGSLASSLESFTVIARADTLIVTDSILTVAPGIAASDPLVTEIESFSPAEPLPSWPVIYTIVSPPDVGPHTIELPGGVLVDTVATGTDGAVSSVTLTRLNASQPATAIVEVRSFRTRGGAVPGSGQRFTVNFQ
jgi:Big-like domain-containing protein